MIFSGENVPFSNKFRIDPNGFLFSITKLSFKKNMVANIANTLIPAPERATSI